MIGIFMQINYILGKNPLSTSYIVVDGNRYPKHVHHCETSLPQNGLKYSAQTITNGEIVQTLIHMYCEELWLVGLINLMISMILVTITTK